MKRKPRNAKDGVFAGHMGLDCVVQGLIITVLVLASFFVGVYFDMGYIHIADMIAGNADEEGVIMAFITLQHGRDFPLLQYAQPSCVAVHHEEAEQVAVGFRCAGAGADGDRDRTADACRDVLWPVTLELKGVLAALGLAFLIIPLMEIYKAIMRAVEKE